MNRPTPNLRTTGCTNGISGLSETQALFVVSQLMTCHDHVFVVDQSSGRDRCVIMCSDFAMSCLEPRLVYMMNQEARIIP